MKIINAMQLGFSLGPPFVILYMGCAIFMETLSPEASIPFFNSLFHGINIETIYRSHVPLQDIARGVFSTFLIGWGTGLMTAFFYNWIDLEKRK